MAISLPSRWELHCSFHHCNDLTLAVSHKVTWNYAWSRKPPVLYWIRPAFIAEHEIFITESRHTLDSDVVMLPGQEGPLGHCSLRISDVSSFLLPFCEPLLQLCQLCCSFSFGKAMLVCLNCPEGKIPLREEDMLYITIMIELLFETTRYCKLLPLSNTSRCFYFFSVSQVQLICR